MAENDDSTAVTHDPQGQRFTTRRNGHQGLVEYRRQGDTLTITHTLVPEAIGGRGVAGELVQAVMDFARREGQKVVPQCSYADGWLERHPDYADLRA